MIDSVDDRTQQVGNGERRYGRYHQAFRKQHVAMEKVHI